VRLDCRKGQGTPFSYVLNGVFFAGSVQSRKREPAVFGNSHSVPAENQEVALIAQSDSNRNRLSIKPKNAWTPSADFGNTENPIWF